MVLTLLCWRVRENTRHLHDLEKANRNACGVLELKVQYSAAVNEPSLKLISSHG
jgi:hypothetical protein